MSTGLAVDLTQRTAKAKEKGEWNHEEHEEHEGARMKDEG
jgi:hypothetical protein